MEPKEISLPPFHVVGIAVEGNLKELESGLGQRAYQSLLAAKDLIENRKHDHVMLLQMYPMKLGFNAQVDRFTQMFCYEVTEPANFPEPMLSYTIPESKYVKYTHKGLEKELSRSYDYVYGRWMRETGNEPKGYDFEVWDERYKPESEENEIDMYVALK